MVVVLMMVRFEFLIAMVRTNSVSWNITPCILLNIYRRYEGAELRVTLML
jgi:hypothetical protein